MPSGSGRFGPVQLPGIEALPGRVVEDARSSKGQGTYRVWTYRTRPDMVSFMPERSADHGALGNAIRQLRGGLKISQEELADRSGLHRTYLGGIERGERNPSYTNILRIAEALEVSPSKLLARAERKRDG